MLKRVNSTFLGIQAHETHVLFLNAVSDILYVLDTNPDTELSNMTTKAFYSILINKPRNVNDNPETSKIFTDNIIPNPKVY